MSEGARARKAIFSFIAPSSGVRPPYVQQKRALAKALQRHRWFDEGTLLDTMEKGVLYPIIHYAEVCPNGNRPPASLQDPAALGSDFTLQQGVYAEVKFFSPAVTLAPSSARSKGTVFMGFKKLDSHFSETLEDTWKDWTGARIVYLGLSEEFGLSRLSFYRRLAPRDSADLFMYLVTVECDAVTPNNRIRLLDFVQRLRVERMTGYLSVYRVEELVTAPPSTANLIRGLLGEAVEAEEGGL